MIVVPAIDLRGGRVVRLRQGRAEEETVYAGAPAEVARRFEAEGARRIHLVDLDAAMDGIAQAGAMRRHRRRPPPGPRSGSAARRKPAAESLAQQPAASASARAVDSVASDASVGFQVEVAPFQAVFVTDGRVFVFRRILINGQMYRQGFVLQLDLFLSHLARTYVSSQPMSRFAHLRLRAVDQGRETQAVEAGVAVDRPRITLKRAFPPPLSFVQATLAASTSRPPPAAAP